MKKSIINLQNQIEPTFIKPCWTPSLFEIRQRFSIESGQKIHIDVQIFNNNRETITIPINEFDTAYDLRHCLLNHP